MTCPKCRKELETPKGVNSLKYGFCSRCRGRAFDAGLLLHQANQLYVLKLFKIARTHTPASNFHCPKCQGAMKKVLDHHLCASCQVYWIEDFDADPRLKAPTSEFEPFAIPDLMQAINEASLTVSEHAESRWSRLQNLVPPIKDKPEAKAKAFAPATFGLILAILLVTLLPNPGQKSLNLPHPEVVHKDHHVTYYLYSTHAVVVFEKAVALGIQASEPLSSQPVRLFSAFLFHFSALPLLLAIAVLQLFGARVEQQLGAARYLLLLAFSCAVCNLAETYLAPTGDRQLYLTGSMGGLTTILGYYATEWVARERAPSLKYRPLPLLMSAALLVVAVSQIRSDFAGYSLSYGTVSWVGFGFGALMTEVL